MRKLIVLGLFALSLGIIGSSALAGQVEVCEAIKHDPAYKGLYGLCNAYWSETDPDARQDILDAFNSRAGEDGPTMPGLDEPAPASCPCWDFDAVVQEIACAGLPLSEWESDDTPSQQGQDYARFANSSVSVELYAGYSIWEPGIIFGPEDGVPECAYFGLTSLTIMATGIDDGTDDACRLDVLDLIAQPPLPEDCAP